MVASLSDPLIVGSLVACFAVLALSPSRYVAFGKELIGAALTVVLVVGSGPLVGVLFGNAVAPYVGAYEEVLIFCSAIVLIDYFCGSKNNPVVSLVLCMWGFIKPIDVVVEVAGQMAGGLIGFPILSMICTKYGKEMGGPSVDPTSTPFNTALISEALSSSLLTTTIALLGMTAIGQYFWVKQPAIAVMIRLIVTRPFFGATGPAMNPMLPTTYQVFANGTWPTDIYGHYVIYWVAAPAGAALAAVVLKAALSIGQPAATPAAPKKPKKPKKA